jgi:hypothetical protein
VYMYMISPPLFRIRLNGFAAVSGGSVEGTGSTRRSRKLSGRTILIWLFMVRVEL